MPPADAGTGLIFVENEGLTALATIMPPTPWALNSARLPSSRLLALGASRLRLLRPHRPPRQVGSPIADLALQDAPRLGLLAGRTLAAPPPPAGASPTEFHTFKIKNPNSKSACPFVFHLLSNRYIF